MEAGDEATVMRTLVVGGTAGIGREVARARAARGDEVVLTGRDAGRAEAVAADVMAGDVEGSVRGIALDLNDPHGLADALADVESVDRLVVSAIERDANTVADYDVDRATRLAVLKLVGYTEVVHALLPRMGPDASVVLFGGRAKDRPYPGSITVSTVNGGIVGLVTALALEMAPIRVNAIHPGIIGDSPFWADKPPAVLEGYRARTPTGRLATMADIVGGVDFLLENRGVNAVNLYVDGGWLVT
jgi:NAD(P)-dependent dehydrogenase (short-subunit alcohol dehydrogenase family)